MFSAFSEVKTCFLSEGKNSPFHFNILNLKQRIASYCSALCLFSGPGGYSSDLSWHSPWGLGHWAMLTEKGEKEKLRKAEKEKDVFDQWPFG